MAARSIRHPVFARLYTLMSSREPASITEHRQELLAGLAGRVLELGAGGGANFGHYPAEVSEVLAVEPEPYMRQQALVAATRSPVKITVLDGTADQLPATDGSVDAAVACLVLCSVPNQATALAELRRVLRPGGELRFYEHVLSHRPPVARTQRMADRLLWPRAFGGCHTARDTPAAVSAAGFAIEEQRRMWLAPIPLAIPVATHVLGRARRA